MQSQGNLPPARRGIWVTDFIMAAPAWDFFIPLFPSLYHLQHPRLFSFLLPVLPSSALPPWCSAPSLLPCRSGFSLPCPPPLLQVGQETLNCGIDCRAWDGAVKVLIQTSRTNAMWKVRGKHSVMWWCYFVTLNSFITGLFQVQIQLVREFSLKCTDRRRSQNKCHSSGY